MLQDAIRNVFLELTHSLEQITDTQYCGVCRELSQASIGQHVRHIIELFQSLETGYESGIVDYEARKRDKEIETNKTLAVSLLKDIYNRSARVNKELTLRNCYSGEEGEQAEIRTNYEREIAYNLEHTIHHMALIRVAMISLCDITLPETFGVAPSTTKYRKNVHRNIHSAS